MTSLANPDPLAGEEGSKPRHAGFAELYKACHGFTQLDGGTVDTACMRSPSPETFRIPPRRATAANAMPLATLALVLLVACGSAPRAIAPPVGLPEAFSVGGTAQPAPDWWRSFGAPALDAAIAAAITDNLSLRAARARVEQARAVARRAGSPLFPTLNASVGLQSRSFAVRPTENGIPVSLAAGYEVDLWGRIEATVDAAELDALASMESAQAVGVSLAAQIASLWFQMAERRGQLALLDEQLATNEDLLKLVELRFKHGRAEAADVFRQRQLAESVRGERARIQGDITVAAHALSLLMGRAPDPTAGGDTQALTALPPLPATGVPAALVQRRPDVRAAWLRVRAADRRVAAAVADRFPRLSVSAQANSLAVSSVVDNWIVNLSANLVAPLLDGGQRKAEVERTRAVVDEALHQYGAAILTALGEVEDALVRAQRQAEVLDSLQVQLDLATKAVARARDRYASGATTYVAVLDATRTLQGLQRNVVTAQASLIQFRIDLHRALAGGLPGDPS